MALAECLASDPLLVHCLVYQSSELVRGAEPNCGAFHSEDSNALKSGYPDIEKYKDRNTDWLKLLASPFGRWG